MGAMFGTRRTADFLSKATWWLAGMLTLLALIANLFFLPGQGAADRESVIQRSGKQTIPQSSFFTKSKSPARPVIKRILE